MRKLFLALLPALLWGFPITQDHIRLHPITEIERELVEVYFAQPEIIHRYESAKPLFSEIIAREETPGFFGYHGSTHSFRLFQDILRVLCQDYLGIFVPENFHLMRIPGDPLFDLIEGTKSYYDLFEPAKLATELRNSLIHELILLPFYRKSGILLSKEELSENEIRLLFEAIKKNLLSNTWPKGSTLPAFKAQGTLLAQIKKTYMQKIEALLGNDPQSSRKKKLLLALLDNMPPSPCPSIGHHLLPLFNAHSASKKGLFVKHLQGLLSFDSLVNVIFSLVDEEYRNEKAKKLLQFIFPYWDTRPEQQSRVISINFSLFANHCQLGESTLHVFLANESIEGGERKVTALLEALFDEAGLEKNLVAPLFEEGLIWLHEKSPTGALYQFFDEDPEYCHLNAISYVSEPFGIPVKDIRPSEIAKGAISPFREHQPFQLRLLTSNQHSLNPYRGLKIYRYDLLSPEAREELLGSIRTAIFQTRHDENKRLLFKKKIESLWFGNN